MPFGMRTAVVPAGTGTRFVQGSIAMMSLMADLLSSLSVLRTSKAVQADPRPIKALVFDLASSKGELSGLYLARQILEHYAVLDETGKREFFAFLASDLAIDPAQVETALAAYRQTPDGKTYGNLVRAVESRRQEVTRRLNQVPGATSKLVDMRADLLRFAAHDPTLSAVDQDLKHLFVSWFNRGFLMLRPVNWQSPADVLEKIIQYEAVHAIASYADLRRRLAPEDRRCFAFFHPAMPREPLIFVEVALASEIPDSVQALLADERDILPQDQANTAVFYSISNCQRGLAGISFGNFLIKQVVEQLSLELPNLKTFVTLSPIPGLSAWLRANGLNAAAAEDAETRRALAARYLVEAKRSDGLPADAVARFHLFNGALIHDIHPDGDVSANGIRQSGGAMVNYLYDMKRISSHHEEFAGQQKVAMSKKVRDLAKQAASIQGATGDDRATAQALADSG